MLLIDTCKYRNSLLEHPRVQDVSVPLYTRSVPHANLADRYYYSISFVLKDRKDLCTSHLEVPLTTPKDEALKLLDTWISNIKRDLNTLPPTKESN
jgi:hypothetical protein